MNMITRNILIVTWLLCSLNKMAEQLQCKKYGSILPNGFCLDYMKNLEIETYKYSYVRHNIKVKEIFHTINILEKMAKWQKRPSVCKLITEVLFHKCGQNSTFKKITQKMNFPSLETVIRCAYSMKRYLCFLYHPVCFTSTNVSIESPPCYESCLDTRNHSCKPLASVFAKLTKLSHLCTSLSSHHFRKGSFNCEGLLKANQSSILKCQLRQPFNISRHVTTMLCYKGIGRGFIGRVNVTKDGTACMRWENLNRDLYPTLEKNYCRNPQGYGVKPWCYVDNQGTWRYCDIPKCGENTKDIQQGFYRYLWCLLLFSGILVILVIGKLIYDKVKRRGFGSENITPYFETTLLDSIGVQEEAK